MEDPLAFQHNTTAPYSLTLPHRRVILRSLALSLIAIAHSSTKPRWSNEECRMMVRREAGILEENPSAYLRISQLLMETFTTRSIEAIKV